MSSFSRFQSRNQKGVLAQKKFNKKFIFKGYPSIEITNGEDETATVIQACVVNKQEKDCAYIYTQWADELPIGSIWGAKTLHWLISEEIVTIKDVDWHKYYALLCNVAVDDQWGYFIGPEKTAIDILLKKDIIWETPQKPMLILPGSKKLHFKDKIVIKDRAWVVQEYDAISTPGLVYYSLKATTVDKETVENNQEKEIFIEPAQKEEAVFVEAPMAVETADELETFKINPNVWITLPTANGYFRYNNPNIKVSKLSETSVTFCLPFGVTEVIIETSEEGSILRKKYLTVK